MRPLQEGHRAAAENLGRVGRRSGTRGHRTTDRPSDSMRVRGHLSRQACQAVGQAPLALVPQSFGPVAHTLDVGHERASEHILLLVVQAGAAQSREAGVRWGSRHWLLSVAVLLGSRLQPE